jgi:hypothetical protein
VTRRAGTAWRIFNTRPSFARNATSIRKRMKKVCTAFEGAISIAIPSSSESRPNSPLRREDESNASSSRLATTPPVRAFTRLWATVGLRRIGAMKDGIPDF